MVQNRSHARLAQGDGDKKRDNAVFLLPLFGCIFSLPPMMNLFNHKVLVFGIPLAFLYLLGVWFLMVLIAFLISRKSRKTTSPSPDTTLQTADLSSDQNRQM
ncbi:hypothetical protein FHS77_002009 [Paenochrobactrum gallinarii]|uniref:DUF3311 domain-containing protein n=1 Tax=Paenochrobactrum gallinarii TaxID=643673 RepID=A0A841M7C4_9HYPH|nr:hypothetical protein [Paenochrobactrum gallinarii]MBB6261454.1 hypothetical protein [Paenochrobactrum gallinarii]